MDLAAIKTGLEAWMAIVARDVDNDVALPVEYGRLPKVVHTTPFVLMYLGPIGKLGWDFHRYDYNQTTDEYFEQMRGVRRLPVRFSFRAFNQEWGLNARQFAEDFRTALQSTAAMEALGAAKLALQSSTDLIETDYEYSGRLVSQVDLTVNFGLCGYTRTPSYDAGYIWRADIYSENYIFDEAGTPVVDENGDYVTDERIGSVQVNP